MGSKKSKTVKANPTELTEEDIQFLVKNTHFCREQIQEWHGGFIVLNLIIFLMKIYIFLFKKSNYPIGSLDKKKFIEAFKSLKNHGKQDKFCE